MCGLGRIVVDCVFGRVEGELVGSVVWRKVGKWIGRVFGVCG